MGASRTYFAQSIPRSKNARLASTRSASSASTMTRPRRSSSWPNPSNKSPIWRANSGSSPERRRLMSLVHHIAVGVAQVEKIAAFYREIFDLEERTRHHYADGTLRSIWLDLGGPILMIEHTKSRDEARLQPSDAVGVGLFLLTFRAADAAARRAVEARAEAAGQAIESRTEFSSYFRDPEGNRVAVSHHSL